MPHTTHHNIPTSTPHHISPRLGSHICMPRSHHMTCSFYTDTFVHRLITHITTHLQPTNPPLPDTPPHPSTTPQNNTTRNPATHLCLRAHCTSYTSCHTADAPSSDNMTHRHTNHIASCCMPRTLRHSPGDASVHDALRIVCAPPQQLPDHDS